MQLIDGVRDPRLKGLAYFAAFATLVGGAVTLTVSGSAASTGPDAVSSAADSDLDGVDDASDNCPSSYNPDQRDGDKDGMGNRCDATPLPSSASEVILYPRTQTGRAPSTAPCFHFQWSTNANVNPQSGDLCFAGFVFWQYTSADGGPLPSNTYSITLTQASPPTGCTGTLQQGFVFGPGKYLALNVNYTCPVSADLAVTKTAAPNPVQAGSNLTYTIAVKNNGPDAAGSASVSDTLPTGVTLVGVPTTTQGTCQPGTQGVQCALGTIASGATATVTIVVRPASAGTLSNTASAADAGRDRNYTWALAPPPADPDLWYVSASSGPLQAHGRERARARVDGGPAREHHGPRGAERSLKRARAATRGVTSTKGARIPRDAGDLTSAEGWTTQWSRPANGSARLARRRTSP